MGRVCKCCIEEDDDDDFCVSDFCTECIDLRPNGDGYNYDYLISVCYNGPLPGAGPCRDCFDNRKFKIYISHPVLVSGSLEYIADGLQRVEYCEDSDPRYCEVDAPHCQASQDCGGGPIIPPCEDCFTYIGEIQSDENTKSESCMAILFTTNKNMISDVRKLCDHAPEIKNCCYGNKVKTVEISSSFFNGCDMAFSCGYSIEGQAEFSTCIKIVDESPSDRHSIRVEAWRKSKKTGKICSIKPRGFSGQSTIWNMPESISYIHSFIQGCCFCECRRPDSGLGQGPRFGVIQKHIIEINDVSDEYTEEYTGNSTFGNIGGFASSTSYELKLNGLGGLIGVYESSPAGISGACIPLGLWDNLGGYAPFILSAYSGCSIGGFSGWDACGSTINPSEGSAWHVMNYPVARVGGTFQYKRTGTPTSPTSFFSARTSLNYTISLDGIALPSMEVRGFGATERIFCRVTIQLKCQLVSWNYSISYDPCCNCSYDIDDLNIENERCFMMTFGLRNGLWGTNFPSGPCLGQAAEDFDCCNKDPSQNPPLVCCGPLIERGVSYHIQRLYNGLIREVCWPYTDFFGCRFSEEINKPPCDCMKSGTCPGGGGFDCDTFTWEDYLARNSILFVGAHGLVCRPRGQSWDCGFDIPECSGERSSTDSTDFGPNYFFESFKRSPVKFKTRYTRNEGPNLV